MKSKNLPLAGLLIIGILGISGSTAAAAIDNSTSGANIAEIARTIEINDIELKEYIQRNSIGIIADQITIDAGIIEIA